MTLNEQSDAGALSYLVTEEARMLCDANNDELVGARQAFSEAAYYLSEPIEPDDRARMLAEVEGQLAQADPVPERRTEHALVLANEAITVVDALLRSPEADSDLQIARRALLRGMNDLTTHLGVTRAARLLLEGVAA
jgi:hypothetical protein